MAAPLWGVLVAGIFRVVGLDALPAAAAGATALTGLAGLCAAVRVRRDDNMAWLLDRAVATRLGEQALRATLPLQAIR